jgi:hypothetical protein
MRRRDDRAKVANIVARDGSPATVVGAHAIETTVEGEARTMDRRDEVRDALHIVPTAVLG